MYASATKQKKQIKAMAIVPFFSKFANKSEFIYKKNSIAVFNPKRSLGHFMSIFITKSIINIHTYKNNHH